MLAAVITDMGYEPILTSDPEEALRLVCHGRCRLALVDVHMPGMDGYEFLDRALRADPGTHIILMTGGGFSDELQVLWEGRGLPVLYKPFLAQDVLNLVRGRISKASAAAAV